MVATSKYSHFSLLLVLADSALDRFDYHYIHWVGPMTTAIMNGMLYWAIPIYKSKE